MIDGCQTESQRKDTEHPQKIVRRSDDPEGYAQVVQDLGVDLDPGGHDCRLGFSFDGDCLDCPFFR